MCKTQHHAYVCSKQEIYTEKDAGLVATHEP